MKVLSFAGSLRKDSSNKKLANEAVRLLDRHSVVRAEYVDLKDYAMPLYDGDQEQDVGIPAAVLRLGSKIAEADGLVIATPEYNGGISSPLKNTIDWVSRLKPMPLAGKHLLLLSASPGGWGGARGLWHSRVPFEAIGVHVFPQMMALPNAHTAFDELGRLNDERARQLQDLMSAYTSHAANRAALEAA